MIWILIALYLLILGLELPALLKNKRKIDIWVFTGYYAIGVYMSLAFYYNWPLIEPFRALVYLMGSD